MKVITNTPDRLVLRDLHLRLALGLCAVTALPALMSWGYFLNGIWTGGLILAGIALILLLGCLGSFLRPLTVTLDRPADRIDIVERGLFGTRRETHILHQIHGATTQTKVMTPTAADRAAQSRSRRRRPAPRLHRAVLLPKNGAALPLTQIYRRGPAAETAAAAINGWITAPLAKPAHP